MKPDVTVYGLPHSFLIVAGTFQKKTVNVLSRFKNTAGYFKVETQAYLKHQPVHIRIKVIKYRHYTCKRPLKMLLVYLFKMKALHKHSSLNGTIIFKCTFWIFKIIINEQKRKKRCLSIPRNEFMFFERVSVGVRIRIFQLADWF